MGDDMAEEAKAEEAVAEAAPAEVAPAEEKKADDGGLGADLMDLFEDESEIGDQTLALLTATLDDIDMSDLMEQVREIQDIMDQRRNF
jgi:hypothetical protein